MTSEKPINFNAEMMQAILDGTKKQTRQLMNPQPEPTAFAWKYKGREVGEEIWPYEAPSMCPYGKKGDRLWVREAWKIGTGYGETGPNVQYKFYSGGHPILKEVPPEGMDLYCHKADLHGYGKWFPSIHMPRWASRITLEITNVRVERVGDISGKDVQAEGVDNGKSNPAMGERWENMQRMAFAKLWNSIYAKPKPVVYTDIDKEKRIDHYISYPFESINEMRRYRGKRWIVCGNPWVWVINFKKL